jgi:hypothetical protein
MSYKVKIKDIFVAHENAWRAVVGDNSWVWSWDQIDNAYHDRYHATLIRGGVDKSYTDIEFASEADYVMFMLECS